MGPNDRHEDRSPKISFIQNPQPKGYFGVFKRSTTSTFKTDLPTAALPLKEMRSDSKSPAVTAPRASDEVIPEFCFATTSDLGPENPCSQTREQFSPVQAGAGERAFLKLQQRAKGAAPGTEGGWTSRGPAGRLRSGSASA